MRAPATLAALLTLLSTPAAARPWSIDPAVNCTVHWQTQLLDHYNYRQDTYFKTFQQRYFVCGEENWKPGQPIFWYIGNEADVTLYVKHSGLMWENKDRFGALLVFSEHRYFGETLPFGNESLNKENIVFLTTEQGLADHATFMHDFKLRMGAGDSKVIGFGGSYGGMLCAWMRMKYPHIVDGVIAASAPIFAFPGCDPENTFFKTDAHYGQGYWDVVTKDATPAHGSRQNCDGAVRTAFKTLFATHKQPDGPKRLQEIFKTCSLPDTDDALTHIAYLQLYAWDTMALGNFPFESDYVTGGAGDNLPAYPVRKACEVMVDEAGVHADGDDLLRSLFRATSIFNNVTKAIPCYTLDFNIEQDEDTMEFFQCTEMCGQETYFARNGETDMFWDYPFNITWVNDRCMKKFGVAPRLGWQDVEYANRLGIKALKSYSNIVFSNGRFDPFSSAGITKNVSDSVLAVLIDDGAHHVDLMFSTPDDPPSLTRARAFEMEQIAKWLKEE